MKQEDILPVEYKIKQEAFSVENPSEVCAPESLEIQEVTQADTSKDDSPFSPPAPPGKLLLINLLRNHGCQLKIFSTNTEVLAGQPS